MSNEEVLKVLKRTIRGLELENEHKKEIIESLSGIMHLKTLQNEIDTRWGTASYNPGVSQRDHVILHLMKALGKIAASSEQADHVNGESLDVRKQIADLVICSSRIASLLGLDLNVIVVTRLAEKFPPVKEKP